MPQLDLDGANSKISADKIQGQSGTEITVQAGHNLAGSGSGLTALNGSNISTGTVADARISALTASKLTGALPAISGASLTGISSLAEACNFSTTNDHVYNITGQGQTYICAFNGEVSDVGSNYNTSTYTFTAPATGLYQMSFSIKIHGLEIGTLDIISISLTTSNRAYLVNLEGTNHTFGECVWGNSFLVDMDASDTAYVDMRVNGQSAVNADFKSGSYFSGFRVT